MHSTLNYIFHISRFKVFISILKSKKIGPRGFPQFPLSNCFDGNWELYAL